MGRIRRTWELAKTSWEILNQDRELLVLPVVSFAATLVAIASFLVPLAASGAVSEGEQQSPTTYVVLFAMYLVLSFITVYFQTALVGAAHERLTGGDPTIGSALAVANRHLPQVLAWSALTATVSVVLRSLQERSGLVGRIALSLVGVAWSLATFLVVPTYVIEDRGPIESVKRSGQLLKQTWGENVASQVGFGLLGFVAGLAALPVVALGFLAGGPVLLVTIAVAVVWFGLVAVVMSALNAIFQTALFHHAAGDVADATFSDSAGGGFDRAALSGAFARR